jgi:hypothetical protein
MRRSVLMLEFHLNERETKHEEARSRHISPGARPGAPGRRRCRRSPPEPARPSRDSDRRSPDRCRLREQPPRVGKLRGFDDELLGFTFLTGPNAGPWIYINPRVCEAFQVFHEAQSVGSGAACGRGPAPAALRARCASGYATDAAALASSARAAEVATACCAARTAAAAGRGAGAGAAARAREPSLGPSPDLRRAGQARLRHLSDEHPSAARSSGAGAGAAAQRPELARVSACASGGRRRVRLLQSRASSCVASTCCSSSRMRAVASGSRAGRRTRAAPGSPSRRASLVTTSAIGVCAS